MQVLRLQLARLAPGVARGSRIPLSPMQLSFFDTNPVEMSG
jgi:hypothetical protein